MEILAYLKKEKKLSSERGLVLGQSLLYNGQWAIISRVEGEGFKGPISDVFCVREVRTKNPVLLKVNSQDKYEKDEENPRIFPLDYVSDELRALHNALLDKKYESFMALPDLIKTVKGPRYDYYMGYLLHNSDVGVEIGVDPLDRKKPGIVNKMKGVDLEARLIIRAWSKGYSPTAKYVGAEERYDTDKVMTMFDDNAFKGQGLPQIAEKTLGEVKSKLPLVSMEDLGRYVILYGRR